MDHVVKKLSSERVEGYPRPTGPRLHLEDLNPADILLSRGDSDISNAIVAADGGSYSHAALWSGSGVIETALAGTGEYPFKGDRDVYRHKALPAAAATAVVAAAREQLGNDYAYSDLLLLGILFALGFHPRRPILNVALEALGGRHATKLEEWLDRRTAMPGGRVCTELVAVSYRSPDDGRHTLRVLPKEHRPFAAQESSLPHHTRPREADADDGEANAAMVACSQLLERYGILAASRAYDDCDTRSIQCGGSLEETGSVWSAPVFQPQKLLAGAIAFNAITGAGLGVVTPADLQFSPSLEHIGRVTIATPSP